MLNLSLLKTLSVRMAVALTLAVLLLSFNVFRPVHAAAGDLDASFGNGGKITTNFGGADRVFAIAIQSDNKIVTAGVADASSESSFALARYNSNGDLDPSFGTGGKVRTNFRIRGDEAHALAIQSDGKIVVAGSTGSGIDSGPRDFALARYNSDGSLDSSFGTGGKVTTDFLGSFDDANAIAIQNDGKIVVAGDAFGNAIFLRWHAITATALLTLALVREAKSLQISWAALTRR
ncbi:MAG: delta-60 repeat domain-containing protein [Blastocatellia bacterium]